MMSTLNSSLYRQHIGDTTYEYRSRPVVVGAPYVLCVFIVGVVLLGVGTFVTAHGHSRDPPDPVLLGVGPALLALGGMLLLGSVVVCTVAIIRNRHLRDTLSDDLYTIGASTFYGRDRLAHSDDEDSQGHMRSYPGRHRSIRGVTNPSGPGQSEAEAVMILANTVAGERTRHARQPSTKYHHHQHYNDSPVGTPEGPGGRLYLPKGYPYTSSMDHLGLERIHRADPHQDLLQAFDLGGPEDEEQENGIRGRAYSLSVRHPTAQLAPIENRLRRHLTVCAAIRARQQQARQQEQQQRQQLPPLPPAQVLQVPPEQQGSVGPQRKRSSRRKKGKVAPESPSAVQIHQLPKYDPELLHAFGLGSEGRPKLLRNLSTGDVLDNNSHQQQTTLTPEDWQDDPNITYGSLGNPRRRPSVVMGVRGMQQQKQVTKQQQITTRKPRSSIYASDMELHGRTSGLARSSEPRLPTPTTDNAMDYTGCEGMTSRTGSSPNLPLPAPDSSQPPSRIDSAFDRPDSDNSALLNGNRSGDNFTRYNLIDTRNNTDRYNTDTRYQTDNCDTDTRYQPDSDDVSLIVHDGGGGSTVYLDDRIDSTDTRYHTDTRPDKCDSEDSLVIPSILETDTRYHTRPDTSDSDIKLGLPSRYQTDTKYPTDTRPDNSDSEGNLGLPNRYQADTMTDTTYHSDTKQDRGDFDSPSNKNNKNNKKGRGGTVDRGVGRYCKGVAVPPTSPSLSQRPLSHILSESCDSDSCPEFDGDGRKDRQNCSGED